MMCHERCEVRGGSVSVSMSVSAARAITRAMTTSNGGSSSSSCCRSASASKAKGLYATTNYVTTATTTGRLSAGLKGHEGARAGGMTQMRLPESLLSRNICSVASDSRNLDQQPAGAKTGGNPEQGLGRAPERSLNKAATTTAAAAATRRN